MDWGAIAIAAFTSGVLTSIVNAIANRGAVTAKVFESISQSAATLSSVSEARINKLYDRVQELEEREKTQIQEISSLRSEVAALRGEVSGKDAKIAMLKKELVTREEEIESLRKRVTSLEAELYGRQSYEPPKY